MRRRRSCRVFSVRSVAPVGQQFTHEVNPSEVGTNERLQLLSADEHHSARRVDEHNRRAFDKSRLAPEFGGYDEAPSIAHRHRVCPMHIPTVPLPLGMWDTVHNSRRRPHRRRRVSRPLYRREHSLDAADGIVDGRPRNGPQGFWRTFARTLPR